MINYYSLLDYTLLGQKSRLKATISPIIFFYKIIAGALKNTTYTYENDRLHGKAAAPITLGRFSFTEGTCEFIKFVMGQTGTLIEKSLAEPEAVYDACRDDSDVQTKLCSTPG